MKNEIFRPVKFWKSACITMPDNSFYELLRSVFGKIKTPFNKQQLLNDLEAFLLREENQKTIAAYIDQNDAKIIAAAALFGEPVLQQLIDFFSDEFGYAQLQDIIVNLEERFILYSFIEEKTPRLALNPVLKSVLLPFTADVSMLFPAVQEKISAAAPKACVNDFMVAGLYSFAFRHEAFFKPDGSIRKKVIDEGKTVFSGIDFEKTIGALRVLGLFYDDAEKLVPEEIYFDDFRLLTARERNEYCAAALLVYDELNSSPEILPPVYRGRIRGIINLIHNFLDFLKPETQYNIKTLKRMIEVLKAHTDLKIAAETLMEAMEKTGLMAETSSALWKLGASAPEKTGDNKKDRKKNPVIAIDSGSSVLVYPEIDFSDAIKLASVLSISEANTVIRFELDKDCAVRAFDNKISAEEIINLLFKLSGGKTNDTLVWNLRDWEKRHGEVSLKKGVILSLSHEHRYLTRTNPLAAMILETPAPGLYLLNENAEEGAADALQNAGIDIIARLPGNEGSVKNIRKQPSVSSGKYFQSPDNSSLSLQKNFFTFNKNPKKNSLAPSCQCEIKSEFHSLLKKMPLSEQSRAELSARIERRLIISDVQLKDADIRFEKLEARHMDYAGKQNIAKQAVSQQSPVEIVMTNKGKEKKIFGMPQALEKDGNELILVVDGTRIPLAKIGLLRRIKKSIFEK